MNPVVFDILHPAHLHFFKKTFQKLNDLGISFTLCTREKEITALLAEELNLTQRVLTRKKKGSLFLYTEGVERVYQLSKIVLQEKPSLLVGVMGLTLSPVAKLFNIPSLIFYDTETARLSNQFSFRLATRVCVPDSYQGPTLPNLIRYPSYQTLAALHELGLKKLSEPPSNLKRNLIVFRWVNRNSIHEFFERNRPWKNREAWLSGAHSTTHEAPEVIISSESPLPDHLKKYEFTGKKSSFHTLLSCANLVISESPTVCSESACLGTPSFYLCASPRGYIHEIEKKYGLIKSISSDQEPNFISELSRSSWRSHFPDDLRQSHQRLLNEKIDPNEFILKQILEMKCRGLR